MQVKNEKRRLREEALTRRDALDPQWRVEASLAIAEALGGIDIEPGTVVSGFLPIRSEVDLRPGMAALHDKGAVLCLPAILDKTTIAFRELVRGAEMVPMGFGTFGPGPEARVLQPDLMLVPLAAFDDRGHRIGYGAGYYDRAIARLRVAGKTPRLIAVAFECQRVNRVPDEPHDVPLAEIVTEAGFQSFPR